MKQLKAKLLILASILSLLSFNAHAQVDLICKDTYEKSLELHKNKFIHKYFTQEVAEITGGVAAAYAISSAIGLYNFYMYSVWMVGLIPPGLVAMSFGGLQQMVDKYPDLFKGYAALNSSSISREEMNIIKFEEIVTIIVDRENKRREELGLRLLNEVEINRIRRSINPQEWNQEKHLFEQFVSDVNRYGTNTLFSYEQVQELTYELATETNEFCSDQYVGFRRAALPGSGGRLQKVPLKLKRKARTYGEIVGIVKKELQKRY